MTPAAGHLFSERLTMSALGEATLNGQVLASLFTETCTATGDIDGLLFGVSCFRETTVLNDSDGTSAAPWRLERLKDTLSACFSRGIELR